MKSAKIDWKLKKSRNWEKFVKYPNCSQTLEQWIRKPCYTIIPFYSKSHQDLFYAFREFNSLIKAKVPIIAKTSLHRQTPVMRSDRRITSSSTHASTLSLPLPDQSNKSDHKPIQHIQYSPYDTLVWVNFHPTSLTLRIGVSLFVHFACVFFIVWNEGGLNNVISAIVITRLQTTALLNSYNC